ncbi:hypothetical protein C9321_23240, partial [Escherichia coli]
MSCGVSGCDNNIASGKKNGQGVTTLPFFFKTEKITCKRTARAVLTGMCYSAGSAMRHGSSSL